MKSLVSLITALVLIACMTASAGAETIQPNPVTIDISNLENRCVRTDLAYKDGGRMTLTLFEPERFDAEAIKAVKAGDVIVTDGEEVAVESVTQDGPDIIFNQGTPDEMLFCDGGRDYFEHVMENDLVPWIELGTMETDILEYYPILDWVDPKTGDPLDEVMVYRGDKLAELLQDPEAIPFDVKNVDILYDSSNQIQLMIRYYSPLQ